MIQLVEETSSIEQAEIDELYEEYRYGTRPTFYVYLLTTAPPAFTAAELLAVLQESAEDDDESGESTVKQIEPLDIESFDTIEETRVSYLRAHHYIDEQGNPAVLWELRYAFLWIDRANQFVAVLARDRGICRPLVRAVGKLLGVTPVAPQISQGTIDRVVRSADAARLKLLDSDGIGRSYTGLHFADPTAQASAFAEVQTRLNAGDLRRSGLYLERIGEIDAMLGISAPLGMLYLTRTLPLSILRRWGGTRLTRVIAAIREDESTQLTIPTQMFSLAHVPSDQKKAVSAILRAGLAARLKGRPSSALDLPLTEVTNSLGDQLNISLLAYCPRCGEEEPPHCRECGGTAFALQSGDLRCTVCERSVTVTCVQGHAIDLDDPIDAIRAEPSDALRRSLIERMRGNSGLDSERGYIVVWRRRIWAGNRPATGERRIDVRVEAGGRAAMNLDSPGATISLIEREQDE